MVPSPPERLLARIQSIDLSSVLGAVQPVLEAARSMPPWLAWTLLGAALLFVALGRHSLRLIAGLGVAAVVAVLSMGLLAPRLAGSALPGLLTVVGGGGALALGLLAPGLALGVSLGALFAWGGAWAAMDVAQVHAAFGAVPFGVLGFFFGLVNHRSLSVGLPPFVCAALLVGGSARLLAPREPGALLPELSEAAPALFAFAAVLVLLLGLSLERSRRHRLRVAAKAKPSDAQLARKVAADRARFEQFLGRSPGKIVKKGAARAKAVDLDEPEQDEKTDPSGPPKMS